MQISKPSGLRAAARIITTFAVFAASLAAAAPAVAQEFGPPALLSNSPMPSGYGSDGQVSVAQDESGLILAVWYSEEPLPDGGGPDFEIHLSRSTDGGATWTDPVSLNTDASTDATHDDAPQIVYDGIGAWIVVWRSSSTLGGTTGTDVDLVFSRSTDDGLTWTPPAAIDPVLAAGDSVLDHPASVASDGAGHLVATWYVVENGHDADLLYTRSSDSGLSWTPAQELNAANSATYDDSDPIVRTDGAGHWIVVWMSGDSALYGNDFDILCARSTDNGASWTSPQPVNTNASVDGDDDRDPDVAIDASGQVVAVWRNTAPMGSPQGVDPDIRVARSADYGASWSASVLLNSWGTTDSGLFNHDSYPHVATDGEGTWIATWTSTYGDDGITYQDDVWFVRSTDGGASWSAAGILSSTTSSSTDYDVVFTDDGEGNWAGLWWSYDTLEGRIGADADILRATSSDDGVSWTAPFEVNSNAPNDNPDGPAVVATDGAVWISVWQSTDNLGDEDIGLDGELLFRRSTDDGESWSAPAVLNSNADSDAGPDMNPVIATDGTNWIVAWHDYSGSLLVARSTNDGLSWSAPVALTPYAAYPSLHHSAASWILSWAGQGPGGDFDLMYVRSTDGGASWSTPAPLNANAGSDSGFDAFASYVHDGTSWLALWTTSDSLGGSIGTEGDIVYARSADDGASWSAPTPLVASAAGDTRVDSTPRVVDAGSGILVAAWQGMQAGGPFGNDADFFFSRSTNGGASWSEPLALSAEAAVDALHDSDVVLDSDGAGEVVAIWSAATSPGNIYSTDGDLVLSRSADFGATWSLPERLFAETPNAGGGESLASLAADGSGRRMLVWTSKRPYEGLAGGRFPNVFAAVAGGGASCGDCDDGNPCTQDSCDSEGVCQHADAPAMACRAGTKSALLLKNASMSWKLSGAQATSQDELSDPTTTAAYVMCVYDESGTRARLDVPAAGSCGTKSCWKAISTKGYAYKDASAANDGVSALVLKGSTLAKTKAILKGAGTGLPSVALPLSGGVAVQLHNLETGTCLGSVFSENDILVNDGVKGLFKAVAK